MAEAKKKLAVIDGKSVFYRGYYAMPNLSTKDGVPTGGVFGFATMAIELIKRLKPDYVAVAWDKPKTNIRKRLEMYPAYKAGRKPAPPDFYTQIPILHDLLEAFGWPLYELDDYEADDIMGTLAVLAEKQGIQTMLVTSDLDMLQLVNHDVKVYALKRGFSNIEEFHPESFEQKYGIEAEQFLDLKALKGDSSDNIPGVPGVGEKTAIALLQEYKTLDNIYENLDKIKDSVRKKLEDGKKSAYLSKKIGAIWCDAPLKLDLSAMDGTKIDTEHLRGLLTSLEFRSLLRALPDNMQTDTPVEASMGSVKFDIKTQPIESDKELGKLELKAADTIFLHTRSAGAHGKDPTALIIGSKDKAFALNLTKLDKSKVQKAVRSVLSGAKSVIGYDIKGDIKTLRHLDIDIDNVGHDVLVGAFLINPLLRAQSLTELATANLGYNGLPFEDIPTEDFLTRAGEYIVILRELYENQLKALSEMPKVAELAKSIEWPLTSVLADMEYTGIKINPNYLRKVADELGDQISDIEQTIYGLVDEEFNLNSPRQVSEIFFDKLNLPTTGIKKLPSGFLSTDVNTLNKLAGTHRVVDEFIRYRELAKLKNTYADVLPDMIDENNRLHTTFNLTIAPTGRLSSIDPNLQQIPTKTEVGKKIQRAFIADKGNVFVGADYSQFEIRIAAALSGDKGMIDAFNSDEDIHVQTAALVYGIKPEEVTKTQRYAAKAVNFGIMYGQGPHGLSVTSGMEYGQAREFIAKYFEVRPKLKEYIDSQREKAQKEGFVETLLGRRRPTPDVHSSNFAVREAAYRAAINMPLQGTAADLMKMAMIKIAQELPSSAKMLLQIHDSVLAEVAEKDAEAVGETMKQAMENVYKLPVKLKADISIGNNWGEL